MANTDETRFLAMAETYDRLCRKTVPQYDLYQLEILRIVGAEGSPACVVDLGAGSGIFLERASGLFPQCLELLVRQEHAATALLEYLAQLLVRNVDALFANGPIVGRIGVDRGRSGRRHRVVDRLLGRRNRKKHTRNNQHHKGRPSEGFNVHFQAF